MKTILAIISFVFCVYISKVLAKKYTEKRVFYSDFLDFNKRLKIETSFSQTTIQKMVINIDNNNDFYFCLKKQIESGTFDFDKDYIEKDEIEFYKNYLNTIGLSDKEAQSKYLDGVEIILKDKLLSAEEEEKKHKSLYSKLGILVGLAVFILII